MCFFLVTGGCCISYKQCFLLQFFSYSPWPAPQEQPSSPSRLILLLELTHLSHPPPSPCLNSSLEVASLPQFRVSHLHSISSYLAEGLG